jgi:hypothetical protein
VKNHRQEQETSKKELNGKGKLVKEKDKEIYSLNQKCENLEHIVKKLKSEISDIKSENKKLLKAKGVKVKKLKSVSTSTLPETDQNILNPSSMASQATSPHSSSLAPKNSSNMFPMVSNTSFPSPVSTVLSINRTTMALVNSTPTTLGLISEQDGETFVSDENSNVKAEPNSDVEQNVKVDHENSVIDAIPCTIGGQVCETFSETLTHIKSKHKEADKPSEETDEFDHLIPEERALLIKLKAMFEKIYTAAVPES